MRNLTGVYHTHPTQILTGWYGVIFYRECPKNLGIELVRF